MVLLQQASSEVGFSEPIAFSAKGFGEILRAEKARRASDPEVLLLMRDPDASPVEDGERVWFGGMNLKRLSRYNRIGCKGKLEPVKADYEYIDVPVEWRLRATDEATAAAREGRPLMVYMSPDRNELVLDAPSSPDEKARLPFVRLEKGKRDAMSLARKE